MKNLRRRSTVAIGLFGVLFVALTGGLLAANAPQKGSGTNPEAGLSDQERQALHDSLRSQYAARYAEWISGIDFATIDLRNVHHGEMAATAFGPNVASLKEARDKSFAVAHVHVDSVSPSKIRGEGTDVTVTVKEGLKGVGPGRITVHQASFLEPAQDWQTVTVVDLDEDPLLLPGDDYVVFLYKAQNGRLAPVLGVGQFHVKNGRVTGPKTARLSDFADGMPESDFLAALRG